MRAGSCRRLTVRAGCRDGHNGDVSDAGSGDTADPSEPVTESAQQRSGPGQYQVRAEPRWPILLAVLVSIALQFALPNRHVLSPTFLFPAVELLLLLALVIGDPGRDHRGPAVRRRIILALVIIMTIDNLAAVVEMVRDILNDSKDDTGEVLLATGAAIWLTNVIAFSLWYWLLDRGGPAARAAGGRSRPSFVFAEMQSGDLVAADWSPQFGDYFYLAFTNATAFSPTDTLPLDSLGQDADAGAVSHLARNRRHDHLASRQRPELIDHLRAIGHQASGRAETLAFASTQLDRQHTTKTNCRSGAARQ